MRYFIMDGRGAPGCLDWPSRLIGPFDSFDDADEWARVNLRLPNWIIDATKPTEAGV